MVNLGAFFGEFLGYIITLLIIVVVAAIGFVIGFFLRKSLDKKKAANTAEGSDGNEGQVKEA